ncbi:hypothetical protein ACT3OH_15920 [Vreelandella zhanjiangensis]|uniref:hypothetical protein n=1 Tax=Vreelandella zhanjiangensis TaxID=1121960 RepID=UPI00402A865D
MSLEQAVVDLERRNATLLEEVVRFRDSAMGLNNIYPNVTEGRQSTADGKYFSVPGQGAYMRLYRRNGSSAELIAEFPDRAQVQNLVGTLGGLGVVGGGVNLMTEGAYGLGATGSMQVLSALNVTTIPAGDYVAQGIPVEQRPPGASGFAYVSVNRYNSGNIRIEYAPIGSQSTGNRKWWTTYNSTGGQLLPWVEAFTTGNILGTISQSDGIPTGAIIERGENANGQYVKLTDGTLFCWLRNDNNGQNWDFSGYIDRQIWEFPHHFASGSVPAVTATGCEISTSSPDIMEALDSINAIPMTSTSARWTKTGAFNWSGVAPVILTASGRAAI